MPNVLIALTGTSPAVLTETVWALAHHPTEPVIPDIVIVLSTSRGAEEMRKQLFGPDQLWFTLRQQLLGPGHAKDDRLDFADSPACIKVFEQRLPSGERRALERMDTLEETQAAGDSIVREVWNWVGRPDHRIYASLSGGFKTMSALLYATMTAIGRLDDRALHVLVENPFDGGTSPMFYWPEQPQQSLSAKFDGVRHDGTGYKKGDTFSAAQASAKLVLTEVPFPALSRLFGDYGFDQPPTFSALIERCRTATEEEAPGDDEQPESGGEEGIQTLELYPKSLAVHINETEMVLGPVSFEILRFLALCTLNGKVMKSTRYATSALHSYLDGLLQQDQRYFGVLSNLRSDLAVEMETMKSKKPRRYTDVLSRLRKELESASGAAALLAKALPSRTRRTLEVSRDCIRVET